MSGHKDRTRNETGSAFDVGGNGSALGVASVADVTVWDLLPAVDARSRNGVLYDLDGDGNGTDSLETASRTMANTVFTAINEAGEF